MSLSGLFEFLGTTQKKAPVDAGASNTAKHGETLMDTIVQHYTEIDTSQEAGLLSTNGYTRSRAQRWLQSRINEATTSPKVEMAELTPELAKLLLSRNEHNRPIKARYVDVMASDISAGRWALNGETIIISRDGLLNDGQHRCAAVVAANRSIGTMMVFGVERDSRTTVDGGAARNVGDYLQMDKIPNGTNVAATARKIMEIEEYGKLVSNAESRHSKQEVLERSIKDLKIQDSVRFCRKPGFGKLGALSMLATSHYLFKRVDASAADEFMKKLIVGDQLQQYSPVWTAREKLLNPGGRLSQNEKLKAIIMGWNNWRAGKTSIKTVTHTVRKGESLPEIRK